MTESGDFEVFRISEEYKYMFDYLKPISSHFYRGTAFNKYINSQAVGRD